MRFYWHNDKWNWALPLHVSFGPAGFGRVYYFSFAVLCFYFSWSWEAE